jgi:hypothetical protein
MVNYTDEELAKKAKKFLILFNKYFNVFMADFLSKDVQDPQEKEELRKSLIEMKVNEEVGN